MISQELFVYLEYRISMLFLWCFVLSFLTLRYRRSVTMLIAAAGFLVTGLLDYVQLFEVRGAALYLAITIFEALLVQALTWLLSEHRDFRAVFTGVTASTYVLLGNAVCTVVSYALKDQVLALLAGALAHGAVLFLLNRQIRTRYREEMRRKSTNWAKLCVMPVLFYITEYSLCIWPANLIHTPQNGLGAVLVLVVMITAYILLFQLFSQRRKDYELEQTQVFLKAHASGLKHEMESLRREEEKLLIRQHDTRHMMGLIRTYLDEGKTDRIYELLSYTEKNMQGELPSRFCENITINGILKQYAGISQKEEIDFACKAEVPKRLDSTNEFEFATVTANLLENAINASKEIKSVGKRWIDVKIHPHKGQLLLEIANYYEGELRVSEESGLPCSVKENGHGYGMRSVYAFAQRMGGIFEYKMENNIFQVRLLINL